MDSKSIHEFLVRKCRSSGETSLENDRLAVEEPLEIRVSFRRRSTLVQKSVSITMRTPGDDRELAVGFLFTEGIIHEPGWIESVEEQKERGASVLVRLNREVELGRLERHFYTTSSCGVCGKTLLEALRINREIVLPAGKPVLKASSFLRMPELVRQRQSIFDHTGGLHAAAFFKANGDFLALREDVGRHNAVDKLIGATLLSGQPRFGELVLFVSGRAGYELVQKAVMAGVPVMAAVGAPSSLAVRLAREYGMTLVGFLRDARFNLYAAPGRVGDLNGAGTSAAGPSLQGVPACRSNEG
jgi:FdhD protein